MKKLVTLCTIIVLCTTRVISADNEEGKDKKTPPGLQKKSGVPPGQAKKKDQTGETAPASSTATAATPAAPAVAPTAAPTAAKPASEPAKAAPTAAKADPTPAVAKPTDPKTALDQHSRAINQAAKANEKAALQQISKATEVSIPELQQQQKYHTEASPTALLIGNLIAKKSGKRFGEILRERQAGKHWADIAKAHNVDINAIIQKASHLAQTLQSTGPAQ